MPLFTATVFWQILLLLFDLLFQNWYALWHSSCKLTFFVRCLSFWSWSNLILHKIYFSITLPDYWWVFTQLARALLIGENGGVLTLLVSKTATRGWQSCICVWSTSQALRLINCNISNRDCGSISINHTAPMPRLFIPKHFTIFNSHTIYIWFLWKFDWNYVSSAEKYWDSYISQP